MLCESVRRHERRDVLDERAAGGDVQDLRAAADREQRQVAGHRPARQIDLELVAPRLGIVDRRVAILAVEHRIDVAAAGQQQAVELVEQLARALADLEHARPCRRPARPTPRSRRARLQRVTPMVGFIAFLLPCCDAVAYIFAGTVAPISSSALVSCAAVVGDGGGAPQPGVRPLLVEDRIAVIEAR